MDDIPPIQQTKKQSINANLNHSLGSSAGVQSTS